MVETSSFFAPSGGITNAQMTETDLNMSLIVLNIIAFNN